MNNITTFANDLLLKFTDAFHEQIVPILQREFGSDWLTVGVRKHFPSTQFSRVEAMLQNPLRAVDMDKAPEDIHGVEHFWQIIDGNWTLFQPYFQDRTRTQVYLEEISELRHNLSHRRGHHVLLKSDLVRIVGNCAKCLSALRSSHFDQFVEVVDSLTSGGTPWGAVLSGRLPPMDDLYTEFVGRPNELKTLADWLSSARPQIVVWGYGGAGKSALAYKFARDVRDSSNEDLIAVCWVSAKATEYAEGASREKSPDFFDTDGLVRAIWHSLYDDENSPGDWTQES